MQRERERGARRSERWGALRRPCSTLFSFDPAGSLNLTPVHRSNLGGVGRYRAQYRCGCNVECCDAQNRCSDGFVDFGRVTETQNFGFGFGFAGFWRAFVSIFF
eukprot:scaffold1085_cov252-Pinguiococcus_pyrenoidosus.AAC.14